jgi:hypothetical protein
MVAAGIWKRQDVDRIEASLYRKVLGIGNMISNRAISQHNDQHPTGRVR